MKIEDIMAKEFVTIQADETLDSIVKILAKNKITCAPVVDEDEFIGVVSDAQLVKYFMQKKYGLLWKKDKESPMGEIKKITARQLAKKPARVVSSSQQLSDVLESVAQKTDYLPVIDQGKLVGLVRGEDIIGFFLKEIAKNDYKESGEVKDKEKRQMMDTELDNILECVKKKGSVSSKQAALELGMTQNTVEKLAEILHRHHLIRISYSFLKGVELESV